MSRTGSYVGKVAGRKPKMAAKKKVVVKPAPQMVRDDPKQVQNAAGGYVGKLNCFKVLERFCILGTAQGTYYANAAKLSKDAKGAIVEALTEDYKQAVDIIVAISDSGRAPKNEPAIFALAVAASHGSSAGQKYALSKLRNVCRIPTHLFHFIEYVKMFRGWGNSLKKAIGAWYNSFEADKLAHVLLKYPSRDGMSHKDVFKMAHPKARTTAHEAVFRQIVQGSLDGRDVLRHTSKINYQVSYKPIDAALLPAAFGAVEEAKGMAAAKNWGQLANLIKDQNLVREHLPTEALNEISVWDALLDGMPITAMIRNLAKMTSIGLLDATSQATQYVKKILADEDYLRAGRVHPITLLVAQRIYQQGKGEKGSLTWNPVARIVEALEESFYLAFGTLQPTNKTIFLALDVSGSMTSGQVIPGVPLTPLEGEAVLAMVLARVEKDYYCYGFHTSLREIKITKTMTLKQAIKAMYDGSFGGTDAAAPMIFARNKGLKIDGFVSMTDNETWYGPVKVPLALRQYRAASGIEARSIVVGMTATQCTVNDPADPLALDVVGFDTATPSLITDFVRE